MSQPATTAQTNPVTRRAEATLRHLQDNVAQRTKNLSDQEKDALADEVSREIKDGLNARLEGHTKD